MRKRDQKVLDEIRAMATDDKHEGRACAGRMLEAMMVPYIAVQNRERSSGVLYETRLVASAHCLAGLLAGTYLHDINLTTEGEDITEALCDVVRELMYQMLTARRNEAKEKRKRR